MAPSNIEGFLKSAQAVRLYLTQGALSSYLEGVDIAKPVSALRYLPQGIGYFLTVPFPWEHGSLRQNLILPEMVLWMLLYPFIFLGMVRGLRLNPQGSILLIMVTAVMVCFYGLYVSNVGIAYRMRSQIWLFWVIFIGWYHQGNYLKKPRGRPVSQ